jgi:YfiH family protein
MALAATFQSSQLLGNLGVKHAFLPAGAGLPPDLIRCHQVHSANVLLVGNSRDFTRENADGLITEDRNPIGIVTADCLPILISDSTGARVAAIHAGWRGIKLGIIYRAIKALEQAGSNPANLVVAIGPAIHACCYEVGKEVLTELRLTLGNLLGNSEPFWFLKQPKRFMSSRDTALGRNEGIWLDLIAIARAQLKSCGVPKNQIECIELCTYCGPEIFASYRRNTHEMKANSSQCSWISRLGI